MDCKADWLSPCDFLRKWLISKCKFFFASGLSQSSVQGESQKNEKKVKKVFGKLAKL